MTSIRSNDSSYIEVTRERDPTDRWSGEDTDTSHSVKSFYIVDDDDYCDISVAFDIDDGRDYYLLYVIYSTGDSFNHNEGQIVFIDLFETKEMAEKNRQCIVEHNKDKVGKLTYSVLLQLEDRRVYQFRVPWQGYFERLTEICIDCIRTGKKG